MHIRHTAITAVLGLAVIFPPVAHAGAPHVPCQYPFVFSDAAVNVVVLPYDDSAIPNANARASGTQLALLLQMDVLSHILGYGNVGAVQLEATPGDRTPCQVDDVSAKILGQRSGAQAQISSGNGVVFVWGLIYEEDDDVYVQSYARFLRRDATEELPFPAGDYKLIAKPTSQLISFAPRHLHKKDLDRIEAAYLRANVVHDYKSDLAPGEELHGIAKCAGCPPDTRPNGFLVVERDGDWIRIRRHLPDGELQDGWIHANTKNKDFELEKELPELSFVEGAVGYLRSRVDVDNKRKPSEDIGQLAEEHFATFTRFADRSYETVAVAVAEQLAGITKVLSNGSYREGLEQAQSSFNRARQLVPYSADAITLSAASELNRATLSRPEGEPVTIDNPRLVAQQLAQASALAPASREAMTNLSTYYKVALNAKYEGDPANRLEKPEIEQQIQELDKRRPPSVERLRPATETPTRSQGDLPGGKEKVTPPAVPQTPKNIPAPQSPLRVPATTTAAPPRPMPMAVHPDSGSPSVDARPSNTPIVAAYDLPGITVALTITPDLLAGILLHDIESWNDPEIRKLNPGADLPAIPIAVIPASNAMVSTALNDYLARSSVWRNRPRGRNQAQMQDRPDVIERGTSNGSISTNPFQPGTLGIMPLPDASANKSLRYTILQ